MTKKIIEYLGSLAVLVIVINAFFIYPSANDYSYFVKQQDYGFVKFQEWHYLNWGGRYIPNIILGSFNFDGFGLYIYRFFALFICLSFYFSLLLFIKKIFRPSQPFYIANFIFLAYCFSLYSISQEFFWMPGSVTYTLSLILAMLSWVILEKSYKVVYFLLNLLLIIILNGTNEISMLFYNASLLIYLVYKRLETKKINFSVLLLLIFSICFMLISILAPGNSVRSQSEINPNVHNLIYSLSRAVFRSITFTVERLFIFLFVAIAFYFELKNEKTIINLNFIPKPLLKVLLAIFPFVVLCFGIFPSYYATGRIPPERTVNVISFFFLLSILFSIWFYKNQFSQKEIQNKKQISPVISIIFFVLLLSYPNELRSNFYDLFSGRSAEFAKEMNQRDHYLKTSPEQDARVKKISVLPNTLLFKDISDNSDTFFNHYYARFYNKKTIKVDK